MVILRRAPALVDDGSAHLRQPRLDDAQRSVLEAREPAVRVLGAPGTGKTTVAVELVVERVRSGELTPDQCLLLTSTRVAAGALRDRVAVRLGGTSTEPLARTHQAFGFGILRREAALRGDPPPRLISGPEQDVVLKDLLAGHARGDAPRPPWPAALEVALTKRGFRAELRDLLMRAVEHGLEADDLARLGRDRDRPEWVAAAQVLREYDEVTSFSRPGAYDPAWILTAAADRLEDDPAALARLREQVRLIVVDEAQELTSAAARLIRVAMGPGMQLRLIGDPDAAVQTFRGADPRILASGWEALAPVGGQADDAPTAPTVVLGTAYRQPEPLARVTREVSARIGALGGGLQRGPSVARAGDPGLVEVALLRATAQEAAHVADALRRAHLVGGMPWDEMAVIVRGRGRDATLRRALATHGVPVAAPIAEVPVRDEVVVRPLLALFEVALRRAADPAHLPSAETTVDLLLSPVGECTAVDLRRLRRLLRHGELAAGGGRSSDELLAATLMHPGEAGALGADGMPLRRLALAVAAGVDALREPEGAAEPDAEPGAEPGARQPAAAAAAGVAHPAVTAETVLWAIWQALDLGDRWRRIALHGGARGARADRDLDAVVALFDAAARFVDRLPNAGPDAFLEHVQQQDVPGDTLVARAPEGSTVAILTPAAAAGRQWRFVVVAGVQEGVWPDLRLRGSLLGSEDLVAEVAGRGTSFRAAQAAVRYDETRLFLVAVSRATERLLVTAVRSEDQQPSVYLDLVQPPAETRRVVQEAQEGHAAAGSGGEWTHTGGGADALEDELRPFTDVSRALTLPALVADLRRRIASSAPSVAEPAAEALGQLAVEGVPGADPARWWALTALSDPRPLREPEQAVRVSPSKVESFATCELRWLLTSAGGDSPSQGSANLGTLIHDIAHELGDELDVPTLVAEVEARWGRLGLRPGWTSDRQREKAHEMVRRLAEFYAQTQAAGWEKVGSEVALRAVVGRAVIAGRVDRLERDTAGALRVVDYKSGSSKPTAKAVLEHPQLATYQVATEHGAFEPHGTESAGAALVQLGSAAAKSNAPQQQPPLAQAEDPAWAEQLVEATADGMGGAEFVATVGPSCQFCPVRSACPAQPEGRSL